MRLLPAALVSFCLLVASAAGAEQTFPYKAFINTDEVYVRSGPGQSYYPTDKLKAGQQVEIYRHDPGGWYAVRPPAGSFTWVSGRFLEPEEDNLALVTGERVAARVGSRFSQIRDVVQVRLNRGEVVEVLDAVSGGADFQGTNWYKITPPSGEFRWVFGKYVDRDYPQSGLRRTTPNAEPRESSPAKAESGDMGAAEMHGDGHTFVAQPESEAELDPAYGRVARRTLSAEQFEAELDDIDMELSIMVVEEPTVWTFDQLQSRTESLLSQAETALERGRARVMVNRITRFNKIKQHHDAVAAGRAKTERFNRQLAALGRVHRENGEDKGPGEERFDGVGELTRVVSPKLGAPRYALIGKTGDVSCYVSPAPGVNLRHYVGHRVGVNGTRGYMPEQRAHHVMAQHVNLLQSRRFR